MRPRKVGYSRYANRNTGNQSEWPGGATNKSEYYRNLYSKAQEARTTMKHCMDIKNDVQRNATAMRLAGSSNKQISRVVNDIVKDRGPIGTGRYACTCNNWGPRFIENSLDGCCEGCFQWALDHHQEMSVNGVEPVTMGMIKNATWGFNVEKIWELNGK